MPSLNARFGSFDEWYKRPYVIFVTCDKDDGHAWRGERTCLL